MTTIFGQRLEVDSVGALVATRASLGAKTFMEVRGASMTYAEAHERSNRLAASLAELGVEHGDRVATYAYNSVDLVCVWFACAKLGAVFTPLNVALAVDDLTYSLNDATPKVLVVDEELVETFVRASPLLEAPPIAFLWREQDGGGTAGLRDFDELRQGAPDDVAGPVTAGDACCIVYTGGSTGLPKGVVVPHLYFFANALRYQDASEATSDDVMMSVGHLFHGGGLINGTFSPMYLGMRTSIDRWFSASAYWDRIRERGATVIDPNGPVIAAVMRQPARADDRDHAARVGIGVGSAQIRQEVKYAFEERYGVPLLECYAQTETGSTLSYEKLDDRRRGTVGRVRGWADVRIAGDQDEELPAGQSGQILLRMREHHCFMLEYFGKPEQTVETWRNLWYHSGDVGYLDEDGYLVFTGRQAHWIRRRGENVACMEVERAIASHAAVVECAVVGVPSDLAEEDVKAFVQLDPAHAGLDPLELVRWCEERIAYFKVPRYIEYVDDFPRSSAKREIERFKLRDRGIGDAWDREVHAPVVSRASARSRKA